MPTQKSTDKWKNKRWFNIYTPKILGEAPIGEMPAKEDSNASGRVIKVSLSWITKNPAHSFMNVGLKVKRIDSNAAHTEIKYLENNYGYIHSLVKRYKSAIYTVDNVKDKDGKALVVKLLAITSGRIPTPKRTGIRKELSKFAVAYTSSLNGEEFLKSVIEGKLQEEGLKVIKKIAPISKLEVKRIEF